MRYAERAAVAKIKGTLGEADELLHLAYENEANAARLLTDDYEAEPTRSILFRSAATLAIQCNEYSAAEKLVALGLIGNPSAEIANEFRDLFDSINFHRHLETKGLVLGEDELQLSISGPAVSVGIAPSEHLITRLEDSRKLILRTISRLKGNPFRDAGPIKSEVKDYDLFISVPRPASFAVSLRVSRPKPLPGFEQEIDYIESSTIIDELMSCLDSFNRSNETELHNKIKEDSYYRNFVGMAKKIAPDGNDIKQVGFTVHREREERSLSLTRTRAQIVSQEMRKAAATEGAREGGLTSITGKLLYADARRGSKPKIMLIDEEGASHRISVPEGMMSDIVKPLWEQRVKVTGSYRRKTLYLEDIEQS
jgi:hypothetical protein